MTEQEAIKNLKFIRDAYKNLSENGVDRYRAVGKGIDHDVEIKTNADLYQHYVESLEMAAEAMEKQKVKPLEEKVNPNFPHLGKMYYCACGVAYLEKGAKYCGNCGQRLKWRDK